MSTGAIGGTNFASHLANLARAATPSERSQPAGGASTFANLLQDLVTQAEHTEKVSTQATEDLAAGRTENIHQVMLDLTRAEMRMMAFVQVRNRLVEAYQELNRMQL